MRSMWSPRELEERLEVAECEIAELNERPAEQEAPETVAEQAEEETEPEEEETEPEADEPTAAAAGDTVVEPPKAKGDGRSMSTSAF